MIWCDCEMTIAFIAIEVLLIVLCGRVAVVHSSGCTDIPAPERMFGNLLGVEKDGYPSRIG